MIPNFRYVLSVFHNLRKNIFLAGSYEIGNIAKFAGDLIFFQFLISASKLFIVSPK